jgi:hypothetical protein
MFVVDNASNMDTVYLSCSNVVKLSFCAKTTAKVRNALDNCLMDRVCSGKCVDCFVWTHGFDFTLSVCSQRQLDNSRTTDGRAIGLHVEVKMPYRRLRFPGAGSSSTDSIIADLKWSDSMSNCRPGWVTLCFHGLSFIAKKCKRVFLFFLSKRTCKVRWRSAIVDLAFPVLDPRQLIQSNNGYEMPIWNEMIVVLLWFDGCVSECWSVLFGWTARLPYVEEASGYSTHWKKSEASRLRNFTELHGWIARGGKFL